ncbi:MAG TPA: NUDIX domain-containing protein [Gaiellaceae bacterium]|nr:NUDIX domain-containing protein [Gaiellaceae bacterium]
MGRVEHVHVAGAAGAPPLPRAEVEVAAGAGIAGDRYAARAGHWRDERVARDLTLVEAEVVEELGLDPASGELRRNVTTRGVRLNELQGRLFWAGGVLCRGAELCEPCRHLEELTGRTLLRPLVHRGGLRAAVVTGGRLRAGDAIEPAEELDGVGVLVVREGRVLLGRRLAAHGRGTWAPPGGKPLAGEPLLECAARELREETGLVARRLRVVGETVDGFADSRLVYRTRFVAAEAAGEPRLLEPDRAAGWEWHPWSRLPEPLFAPVASLARAGFAP